VIFWCTFYVCLLHYLSLRFVGCD